MSLAEQIAFLTNPTPVFQDPEDDQDNDTRAKVISLDNESEERDNDVEDEDEERRLSSNRRAKREEEEDGSTGRSMLRARTAAPLDEHDKRYAGKKISRKEFMGGREDDEQTDDDANDVDEISADDVDEISADDADEEEYEERTEDEEEEEEDGKEKEDLEKDEGNDENKASDAVRHFSEMHLEEDAKKGNAIKCQLLLWDSLLESRIKLQKVMVIANQLPQHDVWKKFGENAGEEFDEMAKESQKKVESLLTTLINLQDILLARNAETKFILDSKNETVASKPMECPPSDEEIPSDTEDEAEKKEDEEDQPEQPKIKKRKLKTDDYAEFLNKRHRRFEQFRNATIEKWSERTKLTSGKLKKSFAGFEQSALKQIENILSDKQRLIKRTQLKRNNYTILGKTKTQSQEKKDAENETKEKEDADEEYDEEIFDDNDFYQQMLRDLIERKTMNVTDPVELTRQWLEIQKLRSKVKKTVDRKASKGRKIRFDIHAKLVNFMAPIDSCVMTDDAKDELFSSLFGKVGAQ